MFNFTPGPKKTIFIIKHLFTFLGIILSIVGLYFLYDTISFTNSATATEGKVISLDNRGSDLYSPIVRFHTGAGEEMEFSSSIGSDPPTYKVGEVVRVLYDPNNPWDAKIDNFLYLYFYVLIFAGLGGLFLTIGGTLHLYQFIKRNRRIYLERYGKPIKAKYKETKVNTFFTVNGEHPYNIICTWNNPITNEVIEFKSENLWFNPEDQINTEYFTVLIDPKNPKKYWVETGFLRRG